MGYVVRRQIPSTSPAQAAVIGGVKARADSGLPPSRGDPWLTGALLVLLCIPWLNPISNGPSPAVQPWLVTAVCCVLSWWFRSSLSASAVAASWMLAALVSATIGVLQYFGLTQGMSPWVNAATIGEAFGNLRQRNQFATLMSIGLVALLGMMALRAKPEVTATGGRAGDGELPSVIGAPPRWASTAAVLLALGNAASNSRTGAIQWFLIAAMVWGWDRLVRHLQAETAVTEKDCILWASWRHAMMLAVQALLAYTVAVLALPYLLMLVTGASRGGLFERFADASGCSSRKILWSNVLTLIAQKPWLGWGWGELDYSHYTNLYEGPRFCDILDNAHNLPLHLAVELGIPVALLVCGGFSCWVWRQRPWRETDPTRQMAWGVLAVILLHSMLEYPLWYGPFQMAFWICIAMLWRGGQTFKSPPGDQIRASNSLLVSVLRTASAMVFIAMLAYVAIDYHRVSQIYLVPQERSAAYREDTLAKIRGSWLFRNQVRFAELLMTPLTRDNAQWTFDTATTLLHFSPEPRVIEKVIESAVMLGNDSEALAHLARFKAAFPEDHARWAKRNGQQLAGLQLQR